MKIDENKFFREATMRICGNLEIDKALQDCLLYIRDYIPADFMGFVIYLPDEKAYESLAVAHLSGSDTIPIKIPATDRDEKLMGTDFSKPRITFFNDQRASLRGRELPQNFHWPAGPSMIIEMVLSGKRMGALIIINEQNIQYSKTHSDLLALLNEPLGIALTNSIRYRKTNQLKNLLADDKRYLQSELSKMSEQEVIGADNGLKRVMKSVHQVSPMNSPVLLLGETGVGKEVIANAIHFASSRWKGPLIKVNCGAISSNLVDSELFGHEKGAFTGAVNRKRGRFERANGGTIFLDEIGELPMDAQVRLLRVLQEKQIERLGGEELIEIDCRIIAATHRDLPDMILQGRFREDLYFRLKIFPVIIPPLRERKVDIPLLVQHFIMKKSRELAMPKLPALAPEALGHLIAYDWPGNVRELENAVERALIINKDQPLTFSDLTLTIDGRKSPPVLQDGQLPQTLESITRNHIKHVMKLSGGKVEGRSGAAEKLGMNSGTLRQKMRKLGIPFGREAKGYY